MSRSNSPSPKKKEKSARTFFQRFPWEKLTIWGLFLVIVYVLSGFFTTIFLTFLFSYIMTNLVWTTQRIISPQRERQWLHRLLTVCFFALLIGSLYGLVTFLREPFRLQIQHLVSQARAINLKSLGSDVLRDTIGAWEYNRKYGGEEGAAKWSADLEAFRTGDFQTAAMKDFQQHWDRLRKEFKGWFRETYAKSYRQEIEEQGQLRAYLRDWIEEVETPRLYEREKQTLSKDWEEVYKRAHGDTADQKRSELPTFEELARDPVEFERVRTQWIYQTITDDQLERYPKVSPPEEFVDYLADRYYDELEKSGKLENLFQKFYEERPKKDKELEYAPFEKLTDLHNNLDNAQRFDDILLGEMEPEEKEEAIEQTFERLQKEELAQAAIEKWDFIDLENINREATNKYIPQLTKGLASGGVFLFNFVLQFILSLLLSFFITFDLHRIRKGIQSLEHSRMKDFYHEIAPGLAAFGALIGRAFQAQGVIAICNTLLTFALVTGLQIPFETFLCTIVFFCSFIPVLGVVISTVPIALVALLYRDLYVASFSVIGVLVIHFIETSILNPKILGEMLHLHPVLVLCILAVGEHFFKVWGLLLGVPVMVYIIRIVILGEDLADLVAVPVSREKRSRRKRPLGSRRRPRDGPAPDETTEKKARTQEKGDGVEGEPLTVTRHDSED